MQAYYEQKDWKQYSVFVHALKSSSRLIGAAVLSEEAAGLEKAADEGREEYISRKHDTVMQNYINTARMIQRILTEAGTTDDTDGDVLEFYPEE